MHKLMYFANGPTEIQEKQSPMWNLNHSDWYLEDRILTVDPIFNMTTANLYKNWLKVN